MRLPLVAALSAAIAAATLSLSPALAQDKKTAKACQEEWRANKADFQAKGITEKAYVAQCRTGANVKSAKPETPAAKPADKPTAPAPGTTAALGTGEYATEAEAKGKCGSDLVVWVNL